MFIYSIKGQHLKIFGVLSLSALVIVMTVLFFPTGSEDYVYPDGVLPAVRTLKDSDFKNVRSNEDRVSFLKLFGWDVDPTATEIAEVIIPTQFDAVYQQYNQLQIGEGLDLEKYKGKSVKRYTYLVMNYEYDGSVYANLLIYNDRVIGGDICSARQDGFVHGFTKGNDFLT